MLATLETQTARSQPVFSIDEKEKMSRNLCIEIKHFRRKKLLIIIIIITLDFL